MNFKKSFLSDSMKNVGKISLGTILGQIISIITLPIFTRIYGPQVIGNWALFTSIAIIVRTISDLGLTNAIMIEESDESAHKIYKVVTTVSLVFSLITGLIVFTGIWNISLNTLFVGTILIILIFTSQQIQICYTWLNRRKQYNVLMQNPLVNNIVMSVFALALGLFGFIEYGYYVSMVMSQIITLLHMKRFLPKGYLCFDIYQYRQTIKGHKQFVIYQMPSNILLQLKGQLPTLLIGTFFGSTILGYYSVSMRVIGMPVNFLANSLGKVFFQSVSEIKRKGGQVGEFTLKGIGKAMKISLIPISVMLCFGDVAIIILFGTDFVVAANIFRIMIGYGFFLFLSMSVNGIAIVIDKQKYLMFSGVSQILGIFFGVWIGANVFDSIYISVFGISLTFSLIQIIYFCFIFKATNVQIRKYLKPLLSEVLLIILIYILVRSMLLLLGVVKTI